MILELILWIGFSLSVYEFVSGFYKGVLSKLNPEHFLELERKKINKLMERYNKVSCSIGGNILLWDLREKD
jgi:hypothetical protein